MKPWKTGRSFNVEALEPRLVLSHPAAGDANRDCHFDQRDIAQVLEAGKFASGQPATWQEGDFNDDGVFDRSDIIAALQTGNYLVDAGSPPEGDDAVCGQPDADKHPPHGHTPQLRPEHNAFMRLAEGVEVTHQVVSSGRWSDPNVWDKGQLPGDGAHVWIPTGVAVTIDGEFAARLATIRLDGSLTFQPDTPTQLNVETLLGMPSSSFTMGSPERPIDKRVTARLNIVGEGPIDREWDPFSLSRGFVSHGRVTIQGAEKTAFSALSMVPVAGDSVLHLTDVPRGWRVGDQVVIAGTDLNIASDDEVRTIVALDAATVTLDRPLQHARPLPRDDMGLQLHVANLTRNAIVESQSRELEQRGHVMFMHTREVDIDYAGFYGLGRTNKDVPLSDPLVDEQGKLIPGTGTNPRGRYAVHFHRNGTTRDDRPATVDGTVVVGSPGWGFVNHSSYVQFTQNVAFDVDGAAFVTEAGDEIGSFTGNIAIHSEGSGGILTNREIADDYGHEGSGFWMQSAAVRVNGNVSAGHASYGFIYFTRGIDESDLGRRASFPAANLPDPRLAQGNQRVPVGEVPLAQFSHNVAYGNWIGLTIRYHQELGFHDDESLVEDFTAWNNVTGINVPYSRQTVFRNLTILAAEQPPTGFGVRTSRLSGDMTFENVHIEGFAVGLRAPPSGQNVIRHGYFNNVQNLVIGTATRPDRSILVTGDIEFGMLPGDRLAAGRQQDIVLGVHLWTNQKRLEPVFAHDSILLDYGPFNLQRVYFPEQMPASVPFPENHFLVPEQYVGLSSQQLVDGFGITVGGGLAPADVHDVPRINGPVDVARKH